MPLSHPSTTNGFFATTTTLFFATFILTTTSLSFPNCNSTFSCGSIRNITYPFTGGDRPDYCGLPDFKLRCVDDNHTEFTHQSLIYRVLEINQSSRTMTIARTDIWNSTCPSQFINTTLNSTYFNYDNNEDDELSLFYGCNLSALNFTSQNMFTCSVNGLNFTSAFYLLGPIPSDPFLKVITCTSIVTVPVFREVGKRLYSNEITLGEALMQGFSVKYDAPYDGLCSGCSRLGGNCGFNVELAQPICICEDMPCTLPLEHSCEGNGNFLPPRNVLGSFSLVFTAPSVSIYATPFGF